MRLAYLVGCADRFWGMNLFELQLAFQAYAMRRRDTERNFAMMTASLLNAWCKKKTRAHQLMSGPTAAQDAEAVFPFSSFRPRVAIGTG